MVLSTERRQTLGASHQRKIWRRAGGIFSENEGEIVGCSVWKSLRKVHKFFLELIGFTVGKGNSVRFWRDSWCSKIPLMCNFHIYIDSHARSFLLWQKFTLHEQTVLITRNSCLLRMISSCSPRC